MWRTVSRVEAEAITGLDLSSADTEPATIDALAGNAELLRTLALTPEPERLPTEYLRVIPVTALPFPHNPFRCPHHQRFDELAKLYDDDPEGVVAGAHWYLTLTPDDFARCPFHQCDWRKVADTGAAILESITPTATQRDLIETCAKQNLPEQERQGLQSLFALPIDWTPGCSTVTNGQHRLCALRAAGAEHCVINTDGHFPYGTHAISVEAAARALLASYKVSRGQAWNYDVLPQWPRPSGSAS
jgi:hypothetical protein